MNSRRRFLKSVGSTAAVGVLASFRDDSVARVLAAGMATGNRTADEMATDEEAQKAIAALNGAELGGRTLVVNEARPQEKRPFGGGGGGRSQGGDRDRW